MIAAQTNTFLYDIDSTPVSGTRLRKNLVSIIYRWSATEPVAEVGTVPGVAGANSTINFTALGLTPNKRYWFYVIARQGTESSLPSNTATEVTWGEVPSWPAGALSRTDKSIRAVWNGNGNPAGTRYRLEVSSDDFNTPLVISSSETTAFSATIGGLLSNAIYKVRVQTIDPVAGPFTSLLSTNTLAAVPNP